ncbi:MAG: Gfo/Idh/MocA family oxidoreductase [Pirellulales bacterium]
MVTRRRVIQAAAALGTFTIVPRHVLGGPKFVPPSEQVNVALVGAGGQGRSNLKQLLQQKDCRVIAVADPADSFSLENFYYKGVGGREPTLSDIDKHYDAAGASGKCKGYVDFREMLDKEKSLDAVLCATPDHVHAFVTANCMRAGKHVYCEKPLTHNIWEARRIAAIATETGVATQMGNQGHSTDNMRLTVEALQAGAIGNVKEVHAWVSGHRWNPTLTSAPKENVEVPKGLNWDLWLGPREPRPFNPAYFPVAWRDFWQFGGSNIGDFGCHDLDAACWALDLKSPTSVDFAPAGVTDKEIGPHGAYGCYEFAARGSAPPVKIFWYDGGLKPTGIEGFPSTEKLSGRGVLFVGDKGFMLCGGAGGPMKILPESVALNFKAPAPSIPRSKGHHRDWLDAIKGGPAASSNFAYGARLVEIVLLGVLSLRSGRLIEWNHDKMEAVGFPEAESLIREPVRAGWEI